MQFLTEIITLDFISENALPWKVSLLSALKLQRWFY